MDSFDYVLKEGLNQALQAIHPVEFSLAGSNIKLSFEVSNMIKSINIHFIKLIYDFIYNK